MLLDGLKLDRNGEVNDEAKKFILWVTDPLRLCCIELPRVFPATPVGVVIGVGRLLLMLAIGTGLGPGPCSPAMARFMHCTRREIASIVSTGFILSTRASGALLARHTRNTTIDRRKKQGERTGGEGG